MDDVAQISCIRAPRFRSLLIREYLDEREVVHRGGVPAHLQPRIEQVVLLIGFIRTLFNLFEFQIIPALLADLRDGDNAEFKASGFGIVLDDLLPKPKDIEIEDMRVSSVRDALGEEVVTPHGKVPPVHAYVIRADGVICHDEAALDDIDEVRQRIRFQHVKEELHFECVVKCGAIPADIVAIKLPRCVPVTEVP